MELFELLWLVVYCAALQGPSVLGSGSVWAELGSVEQPSARALIGGHGVPQLWGQLSARGCGPEFVASQWNNETLEHTLK